MSNQNCLFGSDTDNTFRVMSTVDASVVCSDQHEFLRLDVKTVALQACWVVKALGNFGDFRWL